MNCEYIEKIESFLNKNLSVQCIEKLNIILPPHWKNTFSRPTSSTGKYHMKDDGHIPSTAEHTYEMLLLAEKLLIIFNVFPMTSKGDTFFLAILFHDMFKYGFQNEKLHTDKKHDLNSHIYIQTKKDVFLSFLSESEFTVMGDAIKYHSGRWSTDCDKERFTFSDKRPLVMFVHMLDMLSTQNLIKL